MPPPRRKPKALPGKSTRGPGKPKAQQSKTTCCEDPCIEDREDGKICTNCFTQISEQNIVADVTFEEQANGAAAVQGSLVGANARHGNTFGNNSAARRMGAGEGMSSWDRKKMEGEDAIKKLARDVKVFKDSVVLEAVRLWGLAINANFTAGRTIEESIGACFYAACRRDENNTILLIDVAEQQRVNVFRLGEVYKAFCRIMYIQQKELTYKQMIDIEPLILKYCGKLEFGPDTGKVAEDALKIMRRMKRDWIVPGRHPSGLCGACIILAARMNNYKRTVREIVFVAKIADVTVAKRIEEFRRTKSAALTVNQFRKYANRLKHQHDPPSIHESELRLRKLQELKRKRQAARNEETDENDAIFIDDQLDGSSAAGSPAPGATDQSQGRQKRARTSSQPADPSSDQEPRFDADGFAIPARPVLIDPALLEQPVENNDADATPKKRGRGRPKKVAPAPVEISEEELLLEEELQSDIVKALEEPELNAIAEERERLLAEKLQADSEARSEQLRAFEAQKIQERRTVAGIVWHNSEEHNLLEKPTAEQLEFEFKDDPEVENCILNEQARREKEKIWLYHNEDWLRAQYEKELLKKIADAKGKAPKKKRQSKKGKKGDLLAADATPAATPLDATNRMLAQNAGPGFSRYVDYEALSKVYGHKSSVESSRANSAAPSVSQDGSPSRQSSPAVSGAHASPDAEAPPTPDATQQSPSRDRRATSAPGNPPSPPPTQDQAQAQPGAAAEEDEVDEGVDEDEAADEDDEEEEYRRARYPGGYNDDDDEEGGYGDDDYDEAVDPMGGHSLEGTF